MSRVFCDVVQCGQALNRCFLLLLKPFPQHVGLQLWHRCSNHQNCQSVCLSVPSCPCVFRRVTIFFAHSAIEIVCMYICVCSTGNVICFEGRVFHYFAWLEALLLLALLVLIVLKVSDVVLREVTPVEASFEVNSFRPCLCISLELSASACLGFVNMALGMCFLS